MIGRSTAHHADCVQLRDVLGNRHQLWDGLERPPQIVLIQSRDDDSLSGGGQFLTDVDEIRIEKLPLVDADDVGPTHEQHDLRRRVDGRREDRILVVRDHRFLAVAYFDGWLEDLDMLSRDLRTLKPADQLLGLSAEHRAADHLDPARSSCRVKYEWLHPIRSHRDPLTGAIHVCRSVI